MHFSAYKTRSRLPERNAKRLPVAAILFHILTNHLIGCVLIEQDEVATLLFTIPPPHLLVVDHAFSFFPKGNGYLLIGLEPPPIQYSEEKEL